MSLSNKLLNIYGKYMHLKLFLDDSDIELQKAYINVVKMHNDKLNYYPYMIDAGFDILTPTNEILSNPFANKVDFKIICACKMIEKMDISYNTGFYMYPRSSISKSPLRLANNVGIIDAGYRGHLIGMFDLIDHNTQHIKKFDKYLQICAPGLVPIFVELVNSKEDLGENTARGDGGFGSTGSIFSKA